MIKHLTLFNFYYHHLFINLNFIIKKANFGCVRLKEIAYIFKTRKDMKMRVDGEESSVLESLSHKLFEKLKENHFFEKNAFKDLPPLKNKCLK